MNERSRSSRRSSTDERLRQGRETLTSERRMPAHMTHPFAKIRYQLDGEDLRFVYRADRASSGYRWRILPSDREVRRCRAGSAAARVELKLETVRSLRTASPTGCTPGLASSAVERSATYPDTHNPTEPRDSPVLNSVTPAVSQFSPPIRAQQTDRTRRPGVETEPCRIPHHCTDSCVLFLRPSSGA
jgi:hypothetical protein